MATANDVNISGWTQQASSPTYDGNYTASDRPVETIDPNAFYVAKTGSDSNDGTESSPWLTIQKAANTLVAGEHIYVRVGIYTENNTNSWFRDSINLTTSGTVGNEIIFEAYPDESVIINPNNVGPAFFIGGKEYITVKGFEITNCSNEGIAITDSSSILIENNEIHAVDGAAGGNIAGVRIDDSTNSTIRNNLLYNITVDGGTSNTNGAGVLSFGMDNILIENNTIHTVRRGVYHKRSPLSATGCTIHKNFIYNVSEGVYYGISASGNPPHIGQIATQNIIEAKVQCITSPQDDVSSPHLGFSITNNTLISESADRCVYFTNTGSGTVKDNIFVGTWATMSTGWGNEANGVTTLTLMDYNNYYNSEKWVASLFGSPARNYSTLASWFAGEGYDENSYNSDPVFTDQVNDDYTLQAGSSSLTASSIGGAVGAYITGNEIIGYTA